MQNYCDICGKVAQAGKSVSHSHKKTSRIFKPNLQKISLNIKGKKQQVVICGKCCKSMLNSVKA